MIEITVNNQIIKSDISPDTPLLWLLRDSLLLTGAKYGCGKGLCGSCTVLLDNKPVRSCAMPVGNLGGRHVTTIEGLAENLIRTIENVWAETGASECGYCQPGQVMSALALLMVKPQPTDVDIDKAMSGNLCRCGIYQRIRKAIHRLASIGIPENLHND